MEEMKGGDSMEQTEFIGTLIVSVGVVAPLLLILINATVKMTKSMTLLETTIRHLGEHLIKDEEIIGQHGEKLHEHDLLIQALQNRT